MATLVEDLQALLTPLSTGGAWYGLCTASPLPSEYIVWQRVASPATVALGGPANLQNTRVQIDIYARTVARVVAIETSLEAAMAASSITNLPISSQDLPEPDTRLYRVSKDYSVWATN